MNPTTESPRRFTLFTILLVGTAAFVADFWHVTKFGLLADDWALMGNLLWNEGESPARIVHDLFFFSWEARPLRALEYGLQWCAWRLAGLPGAFLLLWLALTASGVLFTQLMRRCLPTRVALLAGLLFVLFPADTTHIWAATLMAKLGLLYAMISASLFVKDRFWWAGAFALAAVSSYELSIFPLVLMPWWKDGGSWRSLRNGIFVVGGALLLYVAWRSQVFRQLVPDLRAEKDPVGGLMVMREWMMSTLVTIPELLWRWPLRALRIAWMPAFRGITFGLGALIAAGLLTTSRRLGPSPIPAKRLGAALVFGLLAISAGCALRAFNATPLGTASVFSRHNLAAQVGACVLFAAGLGYGMTAPRSGLVRGGFALIAAALLSGFIAFRVSVQECWVDAARYQEAVLRDVVSDLGPLPPHTVVVLRYPNHAWVPREPDAIRPFVTGLSMESGAIFRMVYDESIIAIPTASEQDTAKAYGQTVLSQLKRELKQTTPFHRLVVYTVSDRSMDWVTVRPLEANEALIKPSGPAWEHINRHHRAAP